MKTNDHIGLALGTVVLGLLVNGSAFGEGNISDDPTSPYYVPVPIPTPVFEKEADKAEFIKKAIANNKFNTVSIGDPNKSGPRADKAFCRQFLADFRLQKDMVHLEPMAKADPYTAEAYRPYERNCPSMPRRVSYYLPSNNTVRYTFGRRNTKLFEADFNGQADDGTEVIFYVEEVFKSFSYRDEGEQITGHGGLTDQEVESQYLLAKKRREKGEDYALTLGPGGYRYADFEDCRMIEGFSIADPHFLDYDPDDPEAAVSGIVRYQGTYFGYDYRYTPWGKGNPGRYIRVYDLSQDPIKQSSRICALYNSTDLKD